MRDRFRSEVVVESRPLALFVHYIIDYLNGTLFFKQPVPSRDPTSTRCTSLPSTKCSTAAKRR